jgi:uncharacterized membrane protein YeaQ/YmgE (transglycosylase-associated protein family)
MEFIIWIVLGAIAGWLAGQIMGSKQGLLGNIIVGVIGAFIGGFVMRLLGSGGATGLNIWSIVVSVLGAVVFIWLSRALRK